MGRADPAPWRAQGVEESYMWPPVDVEEEAEEEGSAASPLDGLANTEVVEIVGQYLREAHLYCHWCARSWDTASVEAAPRWGCGADAARRQAEELERSCSECGPD